MTTIKSGRLVALLLLNALWTIPAQADTRYIVRVNGGLPIMQLACRLVGCNVANGLDGAAWASLPGDEFKHGACHDFCRDATPADRRSRRRARPVALVADSSYTVPPLCQIPHPSTTLARLSPMDMSINRPPRSLD